MIRLSATLKTRAQTYADDLGISLNALISVALNDYLNARVAPAEVPSHGIDPVESVASVGASRVPATGSRATSAEPVTESHDYANTPRNAPCPCGSGKKFKQCHGKP